MSKRSLVISDLDKTLIKVNTSFHFGKYLWKKGKLSNLKALALSMHYISYLVGISNAHKLHQKSFKILFQGQYVSVFDELAYDFAQKIIKEKTAAKVKAFINEKRSDGAHLCLLSTGPVFLVKHFASHFGFDTFFGTSYGFSSDGKFSHVEKVIDGAIKAEMASLWMQETHYERTYALTDSIKDLELLVVVSDPIVINPNSRLKKEALMRGFSMIFE